MLHQTYYEERSTLKGTNVSQNLVMHILMIYKNQHKKDY
jgi:hypothetical protein